MSIRILLADDHSILRQSLSTAIQQEEDMEVVGETSDGHSAVDMVDELSPQVVLMDIEMPGLNGIEATRQIMRDNPGSRIIALSMHSAKRFVVEMFKSGASGYLLKDCDYDELMAAIRTVAEGKEYISPDITDVVLDNCLRQTPQEQESVFSVLTTREREVLQLVAEGNTIKQIALRLHISPKTAETHRLNIMKKLDIDNVAQLTKYAIREGLTSSEP